MLEFPILKVIKILDKTDLVVAGQGIEALRDRNDLFVLAIGGPLVEAGGVPLIVPKARLVVKHTAGAYVIATAPELTEQETKSALSLSTSKTVRRQERLNVDEEQMAGNPAGRPIAVGDPVIRSHDLGKFVQYLRDNPTPE
jgi:hypothetical protein